MITPATIQTFHFSGTTVQAYIPTIEWVQQEFEKKESDAAPYWAQVWPAAKALCEVIAADPALVKDKTVLELAAGLGLPSLLAAQYAKEVIISDYIKEAVEIIKLSAEYNTLQNVHCDIIDWNKPGKKRTTQVLLLSDINYEPKNFDQLYKVLSHFIQQGTTIILSTPQRLMAKPFMERLLPFRKKEHTVVVKHNSEEIFISVWILKQ